MKVIIACIVALYLVGCVSIKAGNWSYFRTGKQQVDKLDFTVTPDGVVKVSIEGQKSSEGQIAEALNNATKATLSLAEKGVLP